MTTKSGEEHRWWQKGVIYEAYIRSFQDSDGDGVGDLPGMRRRLDYLQWLGIDILWIPPFYTSPQVEFGYDIADYEDVDPLFGSLAEFDLLLREAHDRGIRVVLDIAPNHTSDRHRWFQESRSSRTNPKRDWYIWRDPAPDGGPPNNWVSGFGGGKRLGVRQGNRAVLLPCFPQGAAGSQLAQSGGGAGLFRLSPVLAETRRGRLPHRRDVAPDQGQ